MNRALKYLTNEGLPVAFMVLYFGGLALYVSPLTRALFIVVTPYTLVLVAFAIFSHHKEWDVRTVAVLSSIFFLSLAIEIIGVATGDLFGRYTYGKGLGLKIADVPVVIGLNWVFLVYASNSFASRYTSSSILIVVGAATLMVLYDILLEKAAPLMDMWQFAANDPPLRNYIVWFVLALLFNAVIQYFKINTQNRPARWLFGIQFGFFIIIVLHNGYI